MAGDVETYPEYLPPVYVGKIPANKYCRGWNSKRMKYCANIAGSETDHHGDGRCKYHGGTTPIKDGTYSLVARDTLFEHLNRLIEQDEEQVMNLREELDLMRGLVVKQIEQHELLVDAIIRWNMLEAAESAKDGRRARPQKVPELDNLMASLNLIVSVKQKMFDQANADAINKKDFFRLQEAQAEVVASKIRTLTYLIGEEEIERIINEISTEWLEIKL